MKSFVMKMSGGGSIPPRAPGREIVAAWIGSCIAIGLIALLERYAVGENGFPLLIGSFGASAVLAFGATKSPLAQPRNMVGGHFLSSLVGVGSGMLIPDITWLAACLAVATAIAVMHIRGPHPSEPQFSYLQSSDTKRNLISQSCCENE